MQKKSHKALLSVLNNVGWIGAILAAIADVIFVIITIVGIDLEMGPIGVILYSTVNACIGVLISVLLRYQGKHYAELENECLVEQYFHKEVKERKHMSMGKWMVCQSIKDILIKGGITAFMLFGTTYIVIVGTHNPIQILITLFTLVLFACFGLVAMNSAYCRYYNVQVPIMEKYIEEHKESVNKNETAHQVDCVAHQTADKVTVEQFVEEREKVRHIVNQSLTAQDEVNKVIEQINNNPQFNPELAEQTHKWCEEHIV